MARTRRFTLPILDEDGAEETVSNGRRLLRKALSFLLSSGFKDCQLPVGYSGAPLISSTINSS